jgi:catechol 2,3-dioxygenase-like lactoylglutathione lyase family enzyme
MVLQQLHHIGITVTDLRRSIEFWTRLTTGVATQSRLLDAPHIGVLVGYQNVRILVANVIVADDLVLELLEYVSESAEPYDPATAHPGNVHICFDVSDIDAAWSHAVKCGAKPVSTEPVVVPSGPQKGSRLAYLRSIDGISIELRESIPAVP